MASLNKAMLIGNLGKDPEVRYTPSGQAVATFSIATSERWNNKQTGTPEERTEWHRIVVWGKLAELTREYLRKGRRVYVEGRLQTRNYTDKDGVKKYTTEITASQLVFLDRAGEGAGSGAGYTATASVDSAASAPSAGMASDGPPPFDQEDDMPF